MSAVESGVTWTALNSPQFFVSFKVSDDFLPDGVAIAQQLLNLFQGSVVDVGLNGVQILR
ncbi:hypothetical protein [Leptothermofonsia sp. ETS-13]|uniref:hypothetical protein n=1 Tax=Leptothermofonsia sp. ETS-13 TaxID=3035696 RepID=UPI003B9EC99B